MTARQPSKHFAAHTLRRSKAARQEAGWGKAGPGIQDRSTDQPVRRGGSTMEVSGLLPLAGACGVVVVVCAPLFVMELLHINTALSTSLTTDIGDLIRTAQAVRRSP